MQHHINSPSKLDLRMKCPGSMYAEMNCKLPCDIDDITSQEGSFLHDCIAKEEIKGTKAQQDIIRDCIETKNIILKDCPTVFYEKQLHLLMSTALPGEEYNILTYGYADCIGIGNDRGIIIEWKFGYKPVAEPEDNIQMACYACMLMQEFPFVKSVDVYKCQPRVSKECSKYTFTDFLSIRDYIINIIENCEKLKDTRTPGSHCVYCRANLECREALNTLNTALITVDRDKTLPVSEKQLYDVYKRIKEVSPYIKRADAYIKQYAKEHENKVGDYLTLAEYKTREIKDILLAWECVKSYTNIQDFLSCCSLTVSKLEEFITQKVSQDMPGLSKDEVKQLAQDILAPCIELKANTKLKETKGE